MRRVEWSTPALRDIDRLFAWLCRYDVDIAERSTRRIVARARWLVEFPNSGSPLAKGRRLKSNVPGTSYLILYRPQPSGIFVSRVYHQRQDWRPR